MGRSRRRPKLSSAEDGKNRVASTLLPCLWWHISLMLSILNLASGTEPNGWAFLSRKDSVSLFLQNCAKALYVLALVAAIVLWMGLVWWVLTAAAEEMPISVRKVVAAVLRSCREAALLMAAGFAFALVTQVLRIRITPPHHYVVIWSGFGRYALWVWEGLVRPLSKLPVIKLKYAAAGLFVMMVLTLLNPRDAVGATLDRRNQDIQTVRRTLHRDGLVHLLHLLFRERPASRVAREDASEGGSCSNSGARPRMGNTEGIGGDGWGPKRDWRRVVRRRGR